MDGEPRVKVISDLKQIKILADPLRQKILSAFVKEPRTTKQAAEFLGLKPTNLYHHVDLLEKNGFLELVSTNQKRGTTERYLRATASRFEVHASSMEGGGSVAEQIIMSAVEESLADLRKVTDDKETFASTGLIYLSESELAEVREQVLAILSCRKNRSSGERKAYRMLTMVVPTSEQA